MTHLKTYLAHLRAEANQLPLFAAEPANAQILLAAVYTALPTGRIEADAPAARGDRAERSRHLSALDVLNVEHRLVLLGGPGSGKSTFLNFVALALAGELLGTSPNTTTLKAPLPQEEGQEEPRLQRWDHEALLPVHVVLRDFAAQLPDAPIGANTLWNFIAGQLQRQTLGRFAQHLQAEMLEHGALVLLDGLDEVPEADRRREQVKQAVQSFASTYRRCRFAVTSSGNVWEWTRSLWGERFSEAQFKYPYDPNDPEREHIGAPDRSYRVLRGGAFYDNVVVARCAFRDRLHPAYRHDGVGFRVVLRGPPVM